MNVRTIMKIYGTATMDHLTNEHNFFCFSGLLVNSFYMFSSSRPSPQIPVFKIIHCLSLLLVWKLSVHNDYLKLELSLLLQKTKSHEMFFLPYQVGEHDGLFVLRKSPGVSRAHSTVIQLWRCMKYNIPQLLVLEYSQLKHLDLITAKVEFIAAECASAVIFGFQKSGALGGESAFMLQTQK